MYHEFILRNWFAICVIVIIDFLFSFTFTIAMYAFRLFLLLHTSSLPQWYVISKIEFLATLSAGINDFTFDFQLF